MRWSIEPRDRVNGKGFGFLSFAKSIDKHFSYIIVKGFLIVLKNLQQMQ